MIANHKTNIIKKFWKSFVVKMERCCVCYEITVDPQLPANVCQIHLYQFSLDRIQTLTTGVCCQTEITIPSRTISLPPTLDDLMINIVDPDADPDLQHNFVMATMSLTRHAFTVYILLIIYQRFLIDAEYHCKDDIITCLMSFGGFETFLESAKNSIYAMSDMKQITTSRSLLKTILFKRRRDGLRNVFYIYHELIELATGDTKKQFFQERNRCLRAYLVN